MVHPCFDRQLADLQRQVAAMKAKDPTGYVRKNAAKRLAKIEQLILETIPADPGAEAFRQGNTLGPSRRHWFRAKFYQQYRLFYRFDSEARVIVCAWVNDDNTRRAYDSKNDAYAVFMKMLDNGNPPDDFASLLAGADALSDRETEGR